MQLDLARPRVMGIVNVTPDSFSDGGRLVDADARDRARAAADRGRRRHRRRRRRIDAAGRAARRRRRRRSRACCRSSTALARRRRRRVGRHDEARGDARGGRRRRRDGQRRARTARADGALEAVAAQPTPRVCLMHMQGEPRTMQAAPAYDDVVRRGARVPARRARGAARRPASRASASSSTRASASARRWRIISRCCAVCRDIARARLSGARRACRASRCSAR